MLRILQERHDSMRQPDRRAEIGEAEELGEALRDARRIYIELEIISPRISAFCVPVLTALELARGDLRELEEVRRRVVAGAASGGDLASALDSAASDVNAARLGLNGLQAALSAYEDSGRLPRRPRLSRRGVPPG